MVFDFPIWVWCLVVISVVTGLMLIIRLLMENVWLGVICLLIPPVWLYALIKHWRELRTPWAISLVCNLIIGFHVWGIASSAAGGGSGGVSVEADLESIRVGIMHLENGLERQNAMVQREYNGLLENRKNLDVKDPAAVNAYNDATRQYETERQKVAALTTQLEAEHATLSTALNQRKAGASTANGSGKVVMFSTQSCGACKMAKNWFQSNGVSFVERDVNADPAARAEFDRLGGRGVPLIVINGKTSSGFSETWVRQQLSM